VSVLQDAALSRLCVRFVGCCVTKLYNICTDETLTFYNTFLGEYFSFFSLTVATLVYSIRCHFQIGSTAYLLSLELNSPENGYVLYMAPRLIYGVICHHVATLRVKCGDSDIIGHSAQWGQWSSSI